MNFVTFDICSGENCLRIAEKGRRTCGEELHILLSSLLHLLVLQQAARIFHVFP